MTIPGQPPQYSQVTDFDLMQTFQDRTLEPRTATPPAVMTTTMWTTAQLVGFLDYRCKRFLRETGIVVARLGFDGIGEDHSITITPGIEAVKLPQNMVDPLRLAFVNYDAASPPNVVSVQDVPREDFTSLDAYAPDWESNNQPTPMGYTQSITQLLQAFLANPPSDVGGIDLTFVAFSEALTGLGVALNIPPELTPYPLYGMMEDAYSVEGEALNVNMAAYCKVRWDEGIILAKALLDSPSFQDAEAV